MGKIERIDRDGRRPGAAAPFGAGPQHAAESRLAGEDRVAGGRGMGAVEVGREVGVSILTVRRWRRRYRDGGVEGLLKDASRPPRKKPLSAAAINKVVDMTLHAKPPAATHWSVRSMAKASGLSPSSVQRIWKAHGLKPHLTRTFKLSRDPLFARSPMSSASI